MPEIGKSTWNDLGLVVIGFILIQVVNSAIIHHQINVDLLLEVPDFYRPKGLQRAEIAIIILKVLAVSAPLTIIVAGLSAMLFSGQLNPLGATIYVVGCGLIYIAFLTYIVADHENAQRLSDIITAPRSNFLEIPASIIGYFFDQYGWALSAESALLGAYAGYRLGSS
ncbi:MAG TPA: hypothetical protein VKT99_11745 [Xanthobacteraceae bacterium]|jgi:hypothetical protein|nr:hypothetical protein [Xanthobacteraceae bacterium]